ncbi:MAG TPA: hypothetical protein VE089_04800, partial [Nitrososphaeraceae archaeon]|nr:hypothetical protein [Nitrososphaeraceae archaeon]
LGENMIENLMRQAVVKQKELEPFVLELGVKANKLEVIHRNDRIEIKPTEWLNAKTWREINEILKTHEFTWRSQGRDSCWIKYK